MRSLPKSVFSVLYHTRTPPKISGQLETVVKIYAFLKLGKRLAQMLKYDFLKKSRIFEIEHLNGHHFVLTLELQAHGEGTQVIWRQTFDTEEHYKQLAAFVAAANEQNLARLAAEVAHAKSAA